tara:strand:- start:156 stop:350 length:195 start_codon:yes stop_codon:yes gene_type:complete
VVVEEKLVVAVVEMVVLVVVTHTQIQIVLDQVTLLLQIHLKEILVDIIQLEIVVINQVLVVEVL